MLYRIRDYSWFYGGFCIAKGALYSIQTSLYGVNYIQRCLCSKMCNILHTNVLIFRTIDLLRRTICGQPHQQQKCVLALK